MIRSAVAAFLYLVVAISGAFAQTCSVPNNLANGNNADATQVMANFNALLSCINGQSAPRGYLSGLTLSTAGSSSSFGIAPGVATSDDAATSMNLVGAYGKTTGSWSVGSGNGALDTGAIATTPAWYHVFLIERTDTGVVDVLISVSPASPTMPTNYNKKRRIGSMKVNSSAQWIKFIQDGDQFTWDVPMNDVTTTNPGTTAVLRTLSIPPGIRVLVQGSFFFSATNASVDYPGGVLITDPSATDTAPGGASNLYSFYGFSTSTSSQVLAMPFSAASNTSQQVRTRFEHSTANLVVVIDTFGWVDRRGRDS